MSSGLVSRYAFTTSTQPTLADLIGWIETATGIPKTTRQNWSWALRTVWVGRYGGMFGPKKIALRFGQLTKRRFGHAMNPHLIRKMVPTELAIHDPAHVGISQPFLGHASYDTTQRAYNLGRSIDAARRVQAMLAAIRQTSSKAREIMFLRGRIKCGLTFCSGSIPLGGNHWEAPIYYRALSALRLGWSLTSGRKRIQ